MDMDPNQNSSTRRKVKFAPTKKKPKPVQAKATKTEEAVDGNDEGSAQAQLFASVECKENLARREPKAERKSSVQVAFGPGGSSLPLRTFGIGKGVHSSKNSGSTSKYFANEQNAIEDQNDTNMIDDTDDTIEASARKIKGEYKEPWDYHHSYYPTTLPLRKPYSGNPEILDEEEFGEAAASVEYDENTVNPAAELELLEKNEQQRMLFFQLPALPLVKQSVSRKGKEKIGTSTVSGEPNKGSALEELPKGYAGKMLVYKSGAVKLKLGETLFDVSPGSNCIFTQDIVAMNTAHKQCCVLGEISKRVVVTPDLDSIEL
ncbi:DNA-directed RNA polymerase III subunit RPC4 [Sesbania bispinosa]|nr:DNA-directed RNA polymerase III subunit RPC4 [Sesbania bispinosa]